MSNKKETIPAKNIFVKRERISLHFIIDFQTYRQHGVLMLDELDCGLQCAVPNDVIADVVA